MPVWMVTGASGFVGRQIVSALCQRADDTVFAVGRSHPHNSPPKSFIPVNLEDASDARRVVAALAPDFVLHAAGQTPPANADALYRSNTLATLHLLDALNELRRPSRVVLAGSAAELGPVPVERLPVGEDYVCRPVDPYGLSKWLATCAGTAAGAPLEVMVGRIFNPIGPGLSTSQAFGRFAAELADPSCRELVVGDLESRRDFIDVRDVARALIALAERGRAGQIYHVGTGRSVRVGDGLERLLQRRGRPVRIRVEPSWHNPHAPRDSRADVRRIAGETGWRATIGWEQSLDDLWDESRRRARLPLTG